MQKSANKTKPKRIVRNVINTSKHGVKNDLCFAAERQIIGDEQANVNAKNHTSTHRQTAKRLHKNALTHSHFI